MAGSKTGPATDGHFRSLSFSLWLSWRELNGRRTVFAINVILVAFLVALAVTLDLMGKARKASVDMRIDYMGPALSIVPEGVGSSDLVRSDLKDRTISVDVIEDVRGELSLLLRGVEARLIVDVTVEGQNTPFVGMDFDEVLSYPFTKYSPRDDEVLMGKIVAGKLNKKTGDLIQVGAQAFTVAGIIETTGSIDDATLFLSLPILQKLAGKERRINEIRIFPKSAAALLKAKQIISERYGGFGVVDSFRGETAEKDIDMALRNYQRIIYAAAVALIALSIMTSTYINLDGRRTEIETIYTLGATRGVVLQVLTLRTAWITFLGSVAGQLFALLATVHQEYQVPIKLFWSWGTCGLIVLGAIVIGLLVTLPFALHSVYRRDLTETL
jgi:putative ABC transport system permease protein